MIVAGNAITSIGRFAAPYWVCNGWSAQVIFIIGAGITETAKQTVVVVLVLQKIPVYTQSEIGSACLVGDLGCLIAGICLSITQFENRIILVFQIDTERCFVLPIVANHQLYGTYQVNSHSHTSKKRYGIWLLLYYLLLALGLTWENSK